MEAEGFVYSESTYQFFLLFSSIYFIRKARKEEYISERVYWIFGLTLIAIFFIYWYTIFKVDVGDYAFKTGENIKAVNSWFSLCILLYLLYNNQPFKLRNQSVLSEFSEYLVKNIFEGKKFLTILNSVLPKGSRDPEHGLDYIPFMLHNVEERRKRFAKTAKAFLTASISVGGLFVAIILYFAYVLLNEQAVGLNKTMSEINENVQKLDAEIDYVSSRNLENNWASFDKIESEIKGYEHLDSVKILFDNLKNTLDVEDYKSKIAPHIQALTPNAQYLQGVRDLEQLNTNLDQTGINKSLIITSTKEIKDLVATANTKVLDNTQYRIDELIKRLILSIVVTTFLVMILRYIIRLYQFNYQQMLNAEVQDMQIRKFYVALKNTETNSDARKAVIEKFLGDGPLSDLDEKPAISADETGILKDTINAILKKL